MVTVNILLLVIDLVLLGNPNIPLNSLFLAVDWFTITIERRIHDLQFMDELVKIEAHDAEVLCISFLDVDSGKNIPLT